MADHLAKILADYEGKSAELIPILQKAQAEYGYLPTEVLSAIAEFVRVPESKVFGVASFFAQFRFVPSGRKRVTVCRGTACHVRGAPQVLEEIERQLGIKEGETSSDLEYTLETVACIGCCALAPCLTVNGEVKATMTPQKVKQLFANEATGEQDVQ